MKRELRDLQWCLESEPPFKSDTGSYLIARSGNKLKIRLPERGLVTLQLTKTLDLHMIGKQQTKKGGFTTKLDVEVAFPTEKKKKTSYSWRHQYHAGPLITKITDFLTKCELNEVIRKQPSIEPSAFEDVTFLRGGKRIYHAAIIRDCAFKTMGFFRKDNKVIIDNRVGNPDLEEDVWILFDCTSTQGSTFYILYNGGDTYYKAKKTKVGFSLTRSPLPSSHYAYIASGGRYRAQQEQSLTMHDKGLLDFAMQHIVTTQEDD